MLTVYSYFPVKTEFPYVHNSVANNCKHFAMSLQWQSSADVTTNTGFFAYIISRKQNKFQKKNMQNIV